MSCQQQPPALRRGGAHSHTLACAFSSALCSARRVLRDSLWLLISCRQCRWAGALGADPQACPLVCNTRFQTWLSIQMPPTQGSSDTHTLPDVAFNTKTQHKCLPTQGPSDTHTLPDVAFNTRTQHKRLPTQGPSDTSTLPDVAFNARTLHRCLPTQGPSDTHTLPAQRPMPLPLPEALAMSGQPTQPPLPLHVSAPAAVPDARDTNAPGPHSRAWRFQCTQRLSPYAHHSLVSEPHLRQRLLLRSGQPFNVALYAHHPKLPGHLTCVSVCC